MVKHRSKGYIGVIDSVGKESNKAKVVWGSGKQSMTPMDDLHKVPRKEKPKEYAPLDTPVLSDFEEGMEEEQTPMTEAKKKFIEGLKEAGSCYTTEVDGGRKVRTVRGPKDSESKPGADEGKPAPKKMEDLLKESLGKFQENITSNAKGTPPASFTQAKASFAEGLKNHSKGK